MARPSRMTPTKMAAMRDGLSAGKSIREVAAELGVSPATLSDWKRRDAAAGVATAPAKPDQVVAPGVAEIDALIAEPLPTRDDPEALVKVRERAVLIQALLVDLTEAVKNEEYPATSFVTLARYGDDLAMRIAELTPPAPKDPNDDPDVIEADKILLARVEKLISDAETGSRST